MPRPFVALLHLFLLFRRETIAKSNVEQQDQWRRDLSKLKIPSIGDDNGNVERLYQALRAPKPKSFVDWTSQWSTNILDYGDRHPFEQRERQHRHTKSSSSSFQPIRITFITDLLQAQKGQDSSTDARINFILSTVLPQVQSIWSSYLSVVPTVGPIPINNSVCDGAIAANNQLPLFEKGINNTDLAILVTYADSLRTSNNNNGSLIDVCGDRTLAVARFCSVDQHDRPFLGLINFCPFNNGTDNNNSNDAAAANSTDEILLAVHELGHVLGMSPLLFPLFRDPSTGNPRTPRPVLSQTVPCTGDLAGTSQTIPFASSNTIQKGVDRNGFVYYDIVTPRVQAVVRNQFNCPTLNGARLESHDTSSSMCIGAHWSQRFFLGELMGAIFFPNTSQVLSPITLALMEDTGWYQVDYGNAQPLGFGQGVGCDFVHGDCIVNDTVPDYGKGYFCSSVTPVLPNGLFSYNGTDFYCDATHHLWTTCDLFDLQHVPSNFQQAFIPKDGIPVTYFSNPNLVSLFPQSNYCPLPRLSLGVVCTDSSTQVVTTYQGEQYGSNSRCINAHYNDTIFGRQRNFPGCFQVECDATANQVIVNGKGCAYDFQKISVQTIYFAHATILCPRLAAVCPELASCPGDCSGRGTCNYATQPPSCECLDDFDTSPNCNATKSTSTPSPVTSSPYTTFPTVSSPSGVTQAPRPTASPVTNSTPTSSASSRRGVGRISGWRLLIVATSLL